jgi:putative membrane protein
MALSMPGPPCDRLARADEADWAARRGRPTRPREAAPTRPAGGAGHGPSLVSGAAPRPSPRRLRPSGVVQVSSGEGWENDRMAFLIRLVVNAVAIWLTSLVVPGIRITEASTAGGQVVVVLVIALVFGLVNAFVKPIVQFFSIPFYILTLGLFTLVVNALMLLLTGWLTGFTHWGLTVDGFWTAVWGGLLISVISWVLSLFLPDGEPDRERSHSVSRHYY